MRSKQTIAFTIHLLLVGCILAFIFSHSLANRETSTAESLGVLEALTRLLSGFGLKTVLTEPVLRKLAHFVEFAALGFFSAHTVRDVRPLRLSGALHVCFFCLLCALTDESLQLLNDRSSQVTDVWLDFSGAVCGCLLFALLSVLWRRRKRARGGE